MGVDKVLCSINHLWNYFLLATNKERSLKVSSCTVHMVIVLLNTEHFRKLPLRGCHKYLPEMLSAFSKKNNSHEQNNS